MDTSQREAQIESMKEAIKETEAKLASGELPSQVGVGYGVLPPTQSFETLLMKQKAALLELERGV